MRPSFRFNFNHLIPNQWRDADPLGGVAHSNLKQSRLCRAVRLARGPYRLESLEARQLLIAGDLDLTVNLGGADGDGKAPAEFSAPFNIARDADLVGQPDGKILVMGDGGDNFAVGRKKAGAAETNFVTARYHLGIADVVPVNPNFPSDPHVQALSPTSARVTWTDAAVEELGYVVERAFDRDFTIDAHLVELAANSGAHTWTDLTADTRYFMRIGIRTSYGIEYDDSYLAVRTPPALNLPVTLTATTVSSEEIELTWTDPSDGRARFYIERSKNRRTWTRIATLDREETEYADDVPEGARRWYRVQITSLINDGPVSDVVSAYAWSAEPSDLEVVGSTATSVKLEWLDNSDTERGFLIEKSLDGEHYRPVVTVNADVTRYKVTGLRSNKRYHFRVSASNDGGLSEPTQASARTRPAGPVPATPTEPTVVDARLPRWVKIKWTTTSTNQTGFRIERRVGEDDDDWIAVRKVSGSRRRWRDESLKSDRTYYYRVVAINPFGQSQASEELSMTTSLAAPSGLVATSSDGQVELNWTDNSPNESGFRIWQYTTVNGHMVRELLEELSDEPGTGPVGHIVTDLKIGSKYQFSVQAFTPDAVSAKSSRATVVVKPEEDIDFTVPEIVTFGEEFMLTLLKFNIPEDLTWTIDWGDGSKPQKITTQLGESGSINVTHTYTAEDDEEAQTYFIQVSAHSNVAHYRASDRIVRAAVPELAQRSSAVADRQWFGVS